MKNFNITKLHDTLEIDISGRIVNDGDYEDETNVNHIIKEIKSYGGIEHLHFNVFSMGGIAHAGMALRSFVAAHPAKSKTGSVFGLAASAATDLISALDHVDIGKYDNIVVHNAGSFVIGDHHELRKEADDLESINKDTAKMWSKRTSLKVQEVQNIMDEDRYMNAEEAVEKGFIDVIREETSSKKSMKCAGGVCLPERLFNKIPEKELKKHKAYVGQQRNKNHKLKSVPVSNPINDESTEQTMDKEQITKTVKAILSERDNQTAQKKLESEFGELTQKNTDLQKQADDLTEENNKLTKSQMTEEKLEEFYDEAVKQVKEAEEIKQTLKETIYSEIDGDTAESIKKQVVDKFLGIELEGDQLQKAFDKAISEESETEQDDSEQISKTLSRSGDNNTDNPIDAVLKKLKDKEGK